jgi:hypothetical protein
LHGLALRIVRSQRWALTRERLNAIESASSSICEWVRVFIAPCVGKVAT